MKPVGKPDARNGPVRFDERGEETGQRYALAPAPLLDSTDPSTGLMWAAKDNGGDITWGNAMKYCQNLGLAGYSGWRLPSVDELQGIYDGSGFSPTHSEGSTIGLAGRPRGELLLTGAREWSSSRVLDDRGRNSGFAWEFDYPHGRRWKDPLGYKGSLRALCVRHP